MITRYLFPNVLTGTLVLVDLLPELVLPEPDFVELPELPEVVLLAVLKISLIKLPTPEPDLEVLVCTELSVLPLL
jgi:hypothetical protein